jgi:16S rRNA G966 N2-methylase RsmD
VRENLARVGTDAARVFRADALSFLRGAARHGELWDLVLCDPPYRLANRLGPALGPLLAPVLGPEARIVCESSVKHPLRLDLPAHGERRYGDTLFAFHAAPEASP